MVKLKKEKGRNMNKTYTEIDKNDEIKDNCFDLYAHYRQHKALFAFYQKYKNIKSEDNVRERLEYLKKNPKIQQRTEIDTLLWLLNEVE